MKVILDNLNNDMAKQYINRCLIHGAEELKKAHIYICGYANIDLVFVRVYDTNARIQILNIPFINQEVHDMDGMQKLSLFHE